MPDSHTQSAPFTYNVQIGLRTLTPVHVGIGADKKWYLNVDYVHRDGNICVLDQPRLYQALAALPAGQNQTLLDLFLQYLSRMELDKIEQLLARADLDFDNIQRYSFPHSGTTPSEIQPQIRDGRGVLYLPGSSIKGAIRSAIFEHLYRILRIPRQDKSIVKELLGDFDRSITRFIRPYDAFFAESIVLNIELFNLYSRGKSWVSDYKDRFDIAVEALPYNTQSSFRLSYAQGLEALLRKHAPEALPTHLDKIMSAPQPIQTLFFIINEHTRRHIQRELKFFKEHPQAANSEEYIEILESVQRNVEDSPRGCVLRLGWGSGFHAMTGDWRFTDHTETLFDPDRENLVWNQRTRSKEPAYYKSRRLGDNGEELSPLGFVEMTLPEGEADVRVLPNF